MRKYAVLLPAAAWLLAGAATVGSAQQKKGQQQQQQQPPAQGGCDLKASHFAVSRAILYIQSAASSPDTAKKQQSLDGAHRSLLEAIEQGQEQNPAVWYYLGIYYYLVGDAPGADSSFHRVEAMVPDCAKDVEEYRQRIWATVINQGIQALRQNDYNKARESFTMANRVYDKDPTADFYMGTIYASEDNADSSLKYFGLAAKLAETDTSVKEIHEKSVQNMARIYQVLEKWDSATAWFRAYRNVRPDDPDALADLGAAYLSGATAARDAGDSARVKDYVERALTLHDSIMRKSEALDPSVLFRWGVAMFRADHSREAAQAFEANLTRTPFYRNGLFNLTNAYFQLAQDKPDSARFSAGKMLPVAMRLVALDPLNRGVLRLIAAAYQFLGKDDSTDIYLKKVNDLKFEVEVESARATGSGYEVTGTIAAMAPPALQAKRDTLARDSTRLENTKLMVQTGKDPATGRAIPVAQKPILQQRVASLTKRVDDDRAAIQKLMAPVSVPAITFEFLDADGKVVATETVAAQAIEPNGTKQFQLTSSAQATVAWRYKAS